MKNQYFENLYIVQDAVLAVLKTVPSFASFYLTGGTALGRFYLDHRYSEDLDFFVNNKDSYKNDVKDIFKKLKSSFSVNELNCTFYDDFSRIYVEKEGTTLKLEFVNDVAYRVADPVKFKYGLIDTPINILSNKLTALISREEPKDVFDICCISETYKFNWVDIIEYAKQKAIINEIDISEKIDTFSVSLFSSIDWLKNSLDPTIINNKLKTISKEIILGANNSLANSDSIQIGKATLNDFK